MERQRRASVRRSWRVARRRDWRLYTLAIAPLLFFAGSACAQLLTAPGTFLAAEGILVTLGTSAPWLFTGTALTVVVAIGRGYRPTKPRRPDRSASSRGAGDR